MDVSLKVRFPDNLLRLRQNGLVAAHLNNPPLMERKRTETASSVAATVADQRKTHFLDCRNPTLRFVTRMICTLIRQRIDLIHLALCQRLRRRILHDKKLSVVRFKQTFGDKRIGIAVLGIKAARIRRLVRQHLLIMRKLYGIIDVLTLSGLIDRAVDKCDIADRQSAV